MAPVTGPTPAGVAIEAYRRIDPADLLRGGFDAPVATDEPWVTHWDHVDDVEALVFDSLPPVVEFVTSGTTGPGQRWQRTVEQLWTEAGMLADLLVPDRPDAVLSFAPPRHVYGALATVLVPARLGVAGWYRPRYFGAPLPTPAVSRWAVVAVPWTFSILDRHFAWVSAAERVSVLHSSAAVPAAAADLVARATPQRLTVTEVFGSTEAGGIATRRWGPGNPPWHLLPDVTFAEPTASALPDGPTVDSPVDSPVVDDAGDPVEVPLAVRSPRLAARAGEEPPQEWRTDDFVQPLDGRSYRFTGRRSRLAKINGRRVNLDEVEEALRGVLTIADLAYVPVVDDTTGEHVDLFVVPDPDHPLTEGGVFEAAARLGARPRRVFLVQRLDRSDTGKLRHTQSPAGQRPDRPDGGVQT